MNADEVVRALRICNRPKGHRCSECPIFSRYEHRTCKATVDKAAAELIESLQAENERLAIHGGRYMQLADERYKMFERAIKRADDAETQLSASQRRADAAVEEQSMNEIEMAIKSFEKFKEMGYSHSNLPSSWSIELALAALREKAEREKGCTHCQRPYVSIGGINEDKAIIYLGAERPYTKGNVEYLHHMDSAGRMNAFKVRHCPMCGKRLDVHHEAD